jgi:hypothetical protein
MSYSTTLAINLAVTIPQMLVALLGAVLALVVRKRLGKAVVPALIGFALLVLAAVVGAGQLIFDYQIPHLTADSHWSVERVNDITVAFSVAGGLLAIAGLAVLVIATVIRRGTETPAAPRPWGPPPSPQPQPGFAPPPGEPGQPGQLGQPGQPGQPPAVPPQGPSPY